jgi:hypothetical protein
MNSKQGTRYIKKRMGDELKRKILINNGIITEDEIQSKPSILRCPRCDFVNATEKFCTSCTYPLNPAAYGEIKASGETKFNDIEERYRAGIKILEQKIKESDDRTNRLISLLVKDGKDGLTTFNKYDFEKLVKGERDKLIFVTTDCELDNPIWYQVPAEDILVVRKENERRNVVNCSSPRLQI